ncbi:hypothetical protein B0H17DRAFT_1208054 [Mycena rosella]|uniref:Haloacid dehalogenase n=1 Tax=Mycena rosella TaxID=1033263 RepID=A0AAD7D240_MYCRO|nr:hypothetical protein B0H17DRAFT_1208054 [Mycena rosella]
MEAKQRIPQARYSQILAHAHADVATRLGLSVDERSSSLFAASLSSWPLFDDAVGCLRTLASVIPNMVGLCDVDNPHAPSFAALEPYFSEYHDALDVPREQRCIVSNGLLRDLEPSRELGVPAVWMRYPGSLAVGVPSVERSPPVKVCVDFADLVSNIHESKTAVSAAA